ncbi:MAG TPA: DNA primase [Luteolibacter sp.]|nr:DNA primase [Luteolibacter sp.]
MAQISKENIEQVLSATDIVDLVNSYVPLKRAGTQFRANCPFHNEKTPSFYVNPARQSFHCFGCGKGGDAISFVRDYENLPFVEAVRKLAQRAGVQVREEEADPEEERRRRGKGRLLDLHREATEFFHRQLLTAPEAEHARAYIKSRGFGREMAVNWQVGWMPENARVFLDWARERKFSGRELVDAGICYLREEGNPKSGIRVRFRDRLMFPIRNEIGDVIAFSGRQLREDPNSGKYINSPETILFRKSRVLFALDRARKPILREKAALLCEGQLDAIACHEAGIDHALAPLGTAFTRDHAKLLKRYTKDIVICYDADAAGLAATTRAFRELSPEGLAVRVARMPAGEDPDSYLGKNGAEGFRKLLDEARAFFEFTLDVARDTGALDSAAGRADLLAECAELLGAMGDFGDRENQINVVAGRLQTSVTALRQEIARLKAKPQWRQRGELPGDDGEAAPVEPTRMHRIVAFMCHLALSSTAAQHLLAEQFETLHEAAPWIEGVSLLEAILTAAPDPGSSSAVNAFLSGLPEADRLALARVAVIEGAPEDGMLAAEHSLSLLSGTVLQRRDASVKAALKQPGLTPERLAELMAEAKEISSLLRGIGQRFEFDDELPPSTFKPKVPEWKKRFQKDRPA